MKQGEAERGIVHALLADLKSCSSRRDLQWGRRVHARAVECGISSNQYIATSLIKMYSKCNSMADARRDFDRIQKPDIASWNALLLGYAENGQGYVSLELFSKMKASYCVPDPVTYVAALKACTSVAANGDRNEGLEMGCRIHSEIREHLDPYVQTTLIDMYGKCGRMSEARRVFDSIKEPNVVTWNALLLGYAENGQELISLELYNKMRSDGCTPNSVTYLAALKACTSLAVNGDKAQGFENGCQIHSEIGNHLDPYVKNTLIDMYAKCGSMANARRVFNLILKPDIVAWNALLSGYAENGEEHVALELFCKLKAVGCSANSVTYVAVLKACTSLAMKGKAQGLQMGRQVHLEIGHTLDPYVQSTLIDTYAKCGCMLAARQVFDSIKNPNVVSWNALLLGYAENGKGQLVLSLFSKMKADGCLADSVTYVAALKGCTSLAVNGDANGKAQGFKLGSEIHSELGDHLDPHVQSTLISMYAKCGKMTEAGRVFHSIQRPHLVSWNALILGYAENGVGHVSLELFFKMKADGYVPNSATYVAVLKACLAEGSGNLEMVQEIHSEIGGQLDAYLQCTLIDIYAKCRSMFDARQVFDSIQCPDTASWTALLSGYAENGEGHMSLELFSRMKALGCAPNSVTYVAALKACGSIGELTFGRKLHSEITEFTAQLVTCLIDFYAKCGSMMEAREVFDQHHKARDVTAWTALLAGYSSCGDAASVFNLLEGMQDTGFRPDGVTFSGILLCCSHAGLVRKAREYLDAMPVQYGVIPEVHHYNCVVDAFGRGNQLFEAVSVMRKMSCNPNAVTWGALLGACRKWKNVQVGKMAFQSFLEIERDTSAYVLMAQIYGSRGMWEEQERVLESKSVCDLPGLTYISDGTGKMVKFVAGEQDLPEDWHSLRAWSL